jgi:hypothetical protein
MTEIQKLIKIRVGENDKAGLKQCLENIAQADMALQSLANLIYKRKMELHEYVNERYPETKGKNTKVDENGEFIWVENAPKFDMQLKKTEDESNG